MMPPRLARSETRSHRGAILGALIHSSASMPLSHRFRKPFARYRSLLASSTLPIPPDPEPHTTPIPSSPSTKSR